MKLKLFAILIIISLSHPIFAFSQRHTKPEFANKQAAIITLKNCGEPRDVNRCEGAAIYLIKRFKPGDKNVFKVLVDASQISDGEFAEVLSEFYSEVLYKTPLFFLHEIANREEPLKNIIVRSATSADFLTTRKRRLRILEKKLNEIAKHYKQYSSDIQIIVSKIKNQ